MILLRELPSVVPYPLSKGSTTNLPYFLSSEISVISIFGLLKSNTIKSLLLAIKLLRVTILQINFPQHIYMPYHISHDTLSESAFRQIICDKDTTRGSHKMKHSAKILPTADRRRRSPVEIFHFATPLSVAA